MANFFSSLNSKCALFSFSRRFVYTKCYRFLGPYQGLFLCTIYSNFILTGYAWSMGSLADGLEHQQTRTEEQPTSSARCIKMVRCFGDAASRIEIYDISANAYYTLRYLVLIHVLLFQPLARHTQSNLLASLQRFTSVHYTRWRVAGDVHDVCILFHRLDRVCSVKYIWKCVPAVGLQLIYCRVISCHQYAKMCARTWRMPQFS